MIKIIHRLQKGCPTLLVHQTATGSMAQSSPATADGLERHVDDGGLCSHSANRGYQSSEPSRLRAVPNGWLRTTEATAFQRQRMTGYYVSSGLPERIAKSLLSSLKARPSIRRALVLLTWHAVNAILKQIYPLATHLPVHLRARYRKNLHRCYAFVTSRAMVDYRAEMIAKGKELVNG